MIVTLLVLLELSALAQDEPQAPDGVRVALRATAETWRDEDLATVYRQGTLVGGVGLVVPVQRWVLVDLDAGFRSVPPRTEGDESHAFKLYPISLLAEVRYPDRADVMWYAGLGPSLTLFSDYNADGHYDPALVGDTAGLAALGLPATTTAEDIEALNATKVISGALLGLETRVGVRVDLHLVDPPAPPAPSGPVRAVELEVFASRRWRAPGDRDGFALQAWRAGVGLALRL